MIYASIYVDWYVVKKEDQGAVLTDGGYHCRDVNDTDGLQGIYCDIALNKFSSDPYAPGARRHVILGQGPFEG